MDCVATPRRRASSAWVRPAAARHSRSRLGYFGLSLSISETVAICVMAEKQPDEDMELDRTSSL
jgi:hypothetical protein